MSYSFNPRIYHPINFCFDLVERTTRTILPNATQSRILYKIERLLQILDAYIANKETCYPEKIEFKNFERHNEIRYLAYVVMTILTKCKFHVYFQRIMSDIISSISD